MEQQTLDKKTKSVLSATVKPDVYARVADLASERDWSVAKTGDFLIRLGLERLEEMKASQEAKPMQMAA